MAEKQKENCHIALANELRSLDALGNVVVGFQPCVGSTGGYSEISKIGNSNLRLGSLADRSFGANAGWFGKRFHKILDPRIDVILGVGDIVAHVRSFAGRGTLVDRSIFAYLYE